MKVNYQLKLEEILNKMETKPQKLLLHSCCAPCSSYCIEYLSNYFEITIYYYNPNISPKEEFQKRAEEQLRFVKELKTTYPVHTVIAPYIEEDFTKITNGLEEEPEGGSRCIKCYYLRMKKAARFAKENHFDYFTTTLSISPYKNSQILNQIGEKIQTELQIKYLYADFKKKNGYLRSIELSNQYQLYRQDYCGCIYSKKVGSK